MFESVFLIAMLVYKITRYTQRPNQLGTLVLLLHDFSCMCGKHFKLSTTVQCEKQKRLKIRFVKLV